MKRGLSLAFVFIIMSTMMICFASAGFFDWIKAITGQATSQPVNLTITVTNIPPTLINVSSISAVNLTEASYVAVNLTFLVSDPDGAGNIYNGTVNFTRSGEVTRSSTCVVSPYNATAVYFNCSVQMWYFDGAGTWNVGVTGTDASNAKAYNTTTTFTVNQLMAFVSSPASLTWPSISPNVYNQTSNNDPLLLNNTGNYPVALNNISMNATRLVGETDNTKALYASNFSVSIVTGAGNPECGAITNQSNTMTRAVFTNLNNATLPKGNFSVNDGSTGQEQLYFCLRYAGAELSAQTYSTLSEGSWTTKIV